MTDATARVGSWTFEGKVKNSGKRNCRPENRTPYTPDLTKRARKKRAWQSPVYPSRRDTPNPQDVWFTRARIRVGLRPV